MGVVGAVVATLGSAFLQGQAARQQAEEQARQHEAQAAQYEAQAKMQQAEAENAAQNAQRANKQAQEEARFATQNADTYYRNLQRKENEQIAKIAASGLAGGTGSPAQSIADTFAANKYDLMTYLNNGMQASYKTSGQATDFSNESNKYDFYAQQNQANAGASRQAAERARAAGKQAEMNAWLMGGFNLLGQFSGIGSVGGGGGDSGTTTGTWATKPSANVPLNPRYSSRW